jgi:ABC-type multidrug transport system fused ATPase/permease subunit
VLLLTIALLINLQGLLSWWLQTYTGENWYIRAELLDHVQRLPVMFHDRYERTDCVHRIQHDAPWLRYVIIQGMIPVLTAALSLIGMIYVAARIEATLALVALAISPLLFSLTFACSRVVHRRSQEIKACSRSSCRKDLMTRMDPMTGWITDMAESKAPSARAIPTASASPQFLEADGAACMPVPG